jgi:hypothetical protein
MAIATSDGAARSILDNGIATTWPAGAILEIRTGAAPGPNAAPTGTLLASIVLPATPWAAAAARAKAKQGVWSVAAVAAGVAAHYRLKQAADNGNADATQVRQEGTVTLTGGGGDMTLDNTNIANAQTVTVNTFSDSL